MSITPAEDRYGLLAMQLTHDPGSSSGESGGNTEGKWCPVCNRMVVGDDHDSEAHAQNAADKERAKFETKKAITQHGLSHQMVDGGMLSPNTHLIVYHHEPEAGQMSREEAAKAHKRRHSAKEALMGGGVWDPTEMGPAAKIWDPRTALEEIRNDLEEAGYHESSAGHWENTFGEGVQVIAESGDIIINQLAAGGSVQYSERFDNTQDFKASNILQRLYVENSMGIASSKTGAQVCDWCGKPGTPNNPLRTYPTDSSGETVTAHEDCEMGVDERMGAAQGDFRDHVLNDHHLTTVVADHPNALTWHQSVDHWHDADGMTRDRNSGYLMKKPDVNREVSKHRRQFKAAANEGPPNHCPKCGLDYYYDPKYHECNPNQGKPVPRGESWVEEQMRKQRSTYPIKRGAEKKDEADDEGPPLPNTGQHGTGHYRALDKGYKTIVEGPPGRVIDTLRSQEADKIQRQREDGSWRKVDDVTDLYEGFNEGWAQPREASESDFPAEMQNIPSNSLEHTCPICKHDLNDHGLPEHGAIAGGCADCLKCQAGLGSDQSSAGLEVEEAPMDWVTGSKTADLEQCDQYAVFSVDPGTGITASLCEKHAHAELESPGAKIMGPAPELVFCEGQMQVLAKVAYDEPIEEPESDENDDDLLCPRCNKADMESNGGQMTCPRCGYNADHPQVDPDDNRNISDLWQSSKTAAAPWQEPAQGETVPEHVRVDHPELLNVLLRVEDEQEVKDSHRGEHERDPESYSHRHDHPGDYENGRKTLAKTAGEPHWHVVPGGGPNPGIGSDHEAWHKSKEPCVLCDRVAPNDGGKLQCRMYSKEPGSPCYGLTSESSAKTAAQYPKGTKWRVKSDQASLSRMEPTGHGTYMEQREPLKQGEVIEAVGSGLGWGGDPGYEHRFKTDDGRATGAFRPSGIWGVIPEGHLEPHQASKTARTPLEEAGGEDHAHDMRHGEAYVPDDEVVDHLVNDHGAFGLQNEPVETAQRVHVRDHQRSKSSKTATNWTIGDALPIEDGFTVATKEEAEEAIPFLDEDAYDRAVEAAIAGENAVEVPERVEGLDLRESHPEFFIERLETEESSEVGPLFMP